MVLPPKNDFNIIGYTFSLSQYLKGQTGSSRFLTPILEHSSIC